MAHARPIFGRRTDYGDDEGAPPTKLHCATRSHPGTHPVHKMCSSPPASTFNLLQQIKSDIVGMPQALKTLYLIHFLGWKNSLFPLLALWGNKNWPPSMKVKKLEIFECKRVLMGCRLSSLNAPEPENPPSHPLFGLEEFPFLTIGPLGK